MNRWHPCRGAGIYWGVGFRWCRCARPPATCLHPSGMPAGAGNAVRGRMWMLGESLRTSADICGHLRLRIESRGRQRGFNRRGRRGSQRARRDDGGGWERFVWGRPKTRAKSRSREGSGGNGALIAHFPGECSNNTQPPEIYELFAASRLRVPFDSGSFRIRRALREGDWIRWSGVPNLRVTMRRACIPPGWRRAQETRCGIGCGWRSECHACNRSVLTRSGGDSLATDLNSGVRSPHV
jgi:hypothetical protein